MRRYVLFAAVALVALAAACGTDDRGSQPTSTPGPGTPTATATPSPTTGSPTASPVTPTPAPNDVAGQQAPLDQARDRWGLARPASYEFDFQWMCFCGLGTDKVRIKVQGNEIVSITNIETGEPVEQREEDYLKFRTIDGLFDWIQEEIDRPTDALTVEYERDFAYPVSAQSDRIAEAIDDELSFRISRFRPNPENVDLDEVRRQLDEAREKWYQAGYQNYTFEFWWMCFCPPEFNKRVKVEVRGGVVHSVTDAATGQPHSINDNNLGYRTVDELFAWIDRELERSPEFVELKFDSQTGFPTKAQFDYIVQAIDDELAFFAADLERLDIHAETQAALDAAKAKWTAGGLQFYRYEFNWGCFCLPEFTERVVVTVQGGEVTSVVKASDGTPVSEEFADDFLTVEGLFGRLQQAIDGDAASITVEFDGETGLPVSAWIDQNYMLADEEIGWQAGGLEEMPN